MRTLAGGAEPGFSEGLGVTARFCSAWGLAVATCGSLLCADEANHPSCTPLRSVLPDAVFPPPTYEADVFFVAAEAQYGSTVRTVSAVVDRSELAEPKLLAIRVH